ncbi:glutamyl-tRNA amidotransferase subunit A (amidase) [Colletotrichum plurivorum]|uniref:Glutamyl-tRNA amidotransferase subunit A (Amidase) n=1 Tax=Colletotrichum plurivorum TaxID=2175906 RepID=A0A8H6JYT0_9PEZI|nr:glutamyl-tRNA amidotransferase subunit A (amidase) [Colletotrichum plurivorum]
MLLPGLLKVFVCLICPALTSVNCDQPPADAFPPLLDATLDELSQGLESGLFTSVDLVNAYIARIEETNDLLHAVSEINPDALSIAASLDVVRQQGGPLLGPLHGIPVLLKDNMATADGMNNTAGSFALVGAKVSEDSTVAAKLRKAGAILLGKASMSQWAQCRSSNATSGWSSYGGQVLGAYYPNQDPSGSSSGSGVASSVGLAWASLGTETFGSITLPCNVNNLVGIKPTVGLTSRYLVVPISEHQDTVGPMARTVKDAAHLLAAIVGPDAHDNYTSAIPFEKTPDYAAACVESGLKGKRLGIPRHLMSETPYAYPHVNYTVSVFDSAVDVLRAAGAEIIDDIILPGYDFIELATLTSQTMGADFLVNLEAYFSELTINPYNISTVADLQDWTQADPREEYPDRDTAVWDRDLSRGLRNTDPGFWELYTRNQYLSGQLGYTGALRNHSLDAIVLPTIYVLVTAAVLGTPVVTVPFGRYPDNTTVAKDGRGELDVAAPNLPFGIGFAGAPFSEETLVGIAYDFEQRTRARTAVKPYTQPKTELADVVKGRREGPFASDL